VQLVSLAKDACLPPLAGQQVVCCCKAIKTSKKGKQPGRSFRHSFRKGKRIAATKLYCISRLFVCLLRALCRAPFEGSLCVESSNRKQQIHFVGPLNKSIPNLTAAFR